MSYTITTTTGEPSVQPRPNVPGCEGAADMFCSDKGWVRTIIWGFIIFLVICYIAVTSIAINFTDDSKKTFSTTILIATIILLIYPCTFNFLRAAPFVSFL